MRDDCVGEWVFLVVIWNVVDGLDADECVGMTVEVFEEFLGDVLDECKEVFGVEFCLKV